MSQQSRSTFVVTDPTEILRALVGLKDVRVVQLCRRGSDVELMIEQVVEDVRCPSCGAVARVKERPVVRYVDLPVYGLFAFWRGPDHHRTTIEPSTRQFGLPA